MAFSSPSSLLSSTIPNPFSCKSTTSPMASLPPSPLKTFSKTLTIPKSSIGLRNFSFPTRASRTISTRTRSSKTSFSVNASQLPLVGNPAPDFEAEAVFDQEFIKMRSYPGSVKTEAPF